MVTFEDITLNSKYNFDYISCERKSMNDIYSHKIVGGYNKIHGFKYSIIMWDHYYNPEIDDYDVVFEGSYRFFSITNNFENKSLTDMTWKRFEDYNMEALTKDLEIELY